MRLNLNQQNCYSVPSHLTSTLQKQQCKANNAYTNYSMSSGYDCNTSSVISLAEGLVTESRLILVVLD